MPVRSVILFIGVYIVYGKAADPEYAKLGGTITLVPTVTGQMDEILWTHKGNKVVEFDGSQNKEFKSFVGRTVLDFVTGDLIISALTAEDSGQYQLEANINNHLKYSIHEVEVIAEVAQPTIICVVNYTKTASMATLQCNADHQDQQTPITYNWERLEDTLRGSVSTNQKLSIAVKDRHDEAVFQCSVSNFVSKKQAQFQVKNCFTDESSSTALAVGLSMLFLIILLIVLGLLLYYKRHRKAKPDGNKQDDVEVPLVQGEVARETGHQNQPDTDEMGQTGLLENLSNPTQLGSEPEAIRNIECEVPAEGHHIESSQSFPTSPGGEEGDEDGLNDTEKGMETRDGKTEQKTNDEGIVEDVMDQNGEEAIVKAEQEKDLSVSETLNFKEDQITANTPDAVALSKPAELSQVQPELDDSKAGRDVDLCQQPKPSSSSSTSLGELVGSEGSNEPEEGMEAGGVGEKKPEREGDTSLGMDRSMETEDAENKSAEDVGNNEQPSMLEEKVATDESEEKNPDKGEKANVSSPVEAVGMDVKNANIEQDVKKDKGGIKVDSQMEVAGSDEQGETGHQKQLDTDKMGQNGLLENLSNPTPLGSEPEAIKNMLETNTESKGEDPAKGHQVENYESFSTSPGGEEGDEDGLNDTEKGMETRDGKTEQKTNDEGIVEDVMDQNGEEAIVKAEQKKDLSVSETLNFKEDQITANTPDAVVLSKPAELSQVQPEPNDSKAGRDVDQCQQPKPSSSSSTSLGELVGSEGSKEAEEGMEAGGVGEVGGDTLGMDRSMETEDAENKSAEDVGNNEQPSMLEDKVATDESEEKNPDKGEKANVSSPVEAVGMDVKNANIEQDVKKDKGGIKVDSQMEVAGSDEQEETGHQKQLDTDKMGQNGLLENLSNLTPLGSVPEAIQNMLETNTESKSEGPAKGHQVENYESFSTSPRGEEGDEDGLNDTEKGMETRDGKTEQKTNDEGIVEDVMDQNGEEAILKAEQEKDLSVSEILNSKEDQITASTPDAVAVSKPAELSQVQPEPNDSKAGRDVDQCQQPKPSSSSSTSLGELVGSEGSNEAEEGMEAGGVCEVGGDTLGMDRSMETEDAENKKSTEDVGNMEQPSMFSIQG